MMALIPLLPHALKSVVTSHLEREPMLIPKFEYAGPISNHGSGPTRRRSNAHRFSLRARFPG